MPTLTGDFLNSELGLRNVVVMNHDDILVLLGLHRNTFFLRQ